MAVEPASLVQCLRQLTDRWQYSATDAKTAPQHNFTTIAFDGSTYTFPVDLANAWTDQTAKMPKADIHLLARTFQDLLTRMPHRVFSPLNDNNQIALAKWSRHLDRKHFSENQIGAILSGQTQDALLIVTHQVLSLGPHSAKFLKRKKALRDIPRVALASNAFPITQHALASEIDFILHSKEGEIGSIPLHAKQVHFMGGYYDACLSNTMNAMISQTLKSIGTPPTIYIHASVTYGKYADSLPRVFLSDRDPSVQLLDYFRLDHEWQDPPEPVIVQTPVGRALRYSIQNRDRTQTLEINIVL